MKVKNAIKKVGAVAGSALMVGMTMGAAQSLSEFPQPFVADDGTVQSQVVVGANAKTADVVGAINVAAALGQNTVQTETRTVTAGGTTETTVNGSELEEGVGDASTPDPMEIVGTDTDVGTFSADDVPQLFRGTIEYEDTDYFVNEQVTLDDSGDNIDISPNGTSTEMLMDVAAGAVSHEVSFTPALPNGSTFNLAGQEYQFIEWDGTNNLAVLGETKSSTGLDTGDSVSFGPYTVTVGKPNLDGNAVQITVSEDGTQIDSYALSDGETETSDDGNLEVTGDAVFVSIDQEVDVSLDLTWRNTEMEVGEDAPFDDQYTVSNIDMASTGAPDEINSITVENQYATGDDEGDYPDAIAEGDAFAGPAGQYSLTFTGLTDERMEHVRVGKNAKVTYTDSNSMEHTVDLREVLLSDGSGFFTTSASVSDQIVMAGDLPISVDSFTYDSSADTVSFTLSYKSWENSVSSVDVSATTTNTGGAYVWNDLDTGYGQSFDLALESSTTGMDGLELVASGAYSGSGNQTIAGSPTDLADNVETGDGASVTATGIDANTGTGTVDDGNTVTVTEATVTSGANDDVTIDFASDGTVDTDNTDDVVYDQAGTFDTSLEEEDSYITNIGSTIDFASDTRVDLMLATDQRYARAALGTYGESTVGGETVEYEAAVGQGDVPSMAMLDSEVTDQTKSNNHLILVGGPAVNQLVADLATAGDTWTAQEWRNQHDGEALVQVVQDAFVQDRHALIVAGHGPEDTRVAAEYISNYADNADELSAAGNQKVLTSANYLN